jgi:hypothetical protein
MAEKLNIKNNKLTLVIEILILAIISAIVYLPFVGKFGYYYDDWYLIFDAHTQGANFFFEVFRADRPLRALVMIPAYTLFGANPLYYNVAAYVFRLAGALSFLWIVRILWPRQRTATFMMGLLFLIYPGFLMQPNAIDYLSHQISLASGMFSIALTMKAVTSNSKVAKWLFYIGAILLGWFCLGLMEYYIGLEIFRSGCVFALLYSKQRPFIQNGLLTVKHWLPTLLIPSGFLFWRLFIFQSERGATDLTAQLGQLAVSPVLKGLWWLVYFFQSILNTVILAWGVPLYDIAFQLRLRDILTGLGIALAVVLIAVGFLFWLRRTESEDSQQEDKPDWQTQAIWLGALGVVGGLVMIIIANRYVNFGDFSRYTLVSSAGAVMLLVGVIYHIASYRLRVATFALLVLIAALTHHANSINAVNEAQSIRAFWWQLNWRVPQIQKGTTLIANYPVSGIPEDYFIWGPANLIYYPEKQTNLPLQVPVPAAILNHENVLRITTGGASQRLERRGVALTQDFDNILVLTQPAVNVCVRVLDGTAPELSVQDPFNIMLVAGKSRMENVLAGEKSAIPPVDVFGQEPVHDWCYYYEKAALAYQNKNWQAVLDLREEALAKGFYPSDRIEWIPFLKAYTAMSDIEGLRPYVSIMVEEPFIKTQTCEILMRVVEQEKPEDKNIKSFIGQSFCN